MQISELKVATQIANPTSHSYKLQQPASNPIQQSGNFGGDEVNFCDLGEKTNQMPVDIQAENGDNEAKTSLTNKAASQGGDPDIAQTCLSAHVKVKVNKNNLSCTS